MKKKCTGVIFFLKNGVFLIKDENMDTSRLNHIAGLIARKRSGGKLTGTEQQELEEWIRASRMNKESYDRIISGRGVIRLMELEKQIDTDRSFKKLTVRLKWRCWKRRILMAGVAAMVMIGIMSAFWWWEQEGITVPESAGQPGIKPGGNCAVLVLGNGCRVDLQKDCDTLQLPGISWDHRKGTIVYDGRENKTGWPERNTLMVPLRGEYRLVLGDGTKVWLNSASSLSYPVQFAEKERCVELDGEAYFEVTPDPERPFIVKSGDVQTRVLGTAFNFSAYRGENASTITLLTGKVAVSAPGHAERVLLPGQQLKYDAENRKTVIKEVDAEDFVVWKDGLFLFNDCGLEEIIPRLSRWYGVTFHYDREKFCDLKFYIKTRRYEDIGTILNLLKLTENVTYSIEGNEVTLYRTGENK